MWPRGDFPIPQFSYDVELRLRQGNDEFEKSGKGVKLTRDQKHDILEKLGSTMYDFKAYPDDKQIGKVAEALVTKHPCLKEQGSDTGWNGWKTSLKFKMGNLRNKMRKIGCLEVAVNAGKRSQGHPENEPSHSKIKKPRRSEVNYLPNFPQGEDETSLETVRQEIAVEVQKTEKNTSLIHKNMEKTFALRRQNIVSGSPSVNEFLNLWPALRMTSELFAEYQRVKNENLPNKFYAQLDYLLPRLMTILRQKASKTGKTADTLANLLKVHDEQCDIIDIKREWILRSLVIYFNEDPDCKLFNSYDEGSTTMGKQVLSLQMNRSVPRSDESTPSEEDTKMSKKPTEQIGSIVSESRPSKSDQCIDCNSDPAFTASDKMENHSQMNRAVPRSGETPPSEEETRPPTKPTEQESVYTTTLDRVPSENYNPT
ncbi:uncharacterized protein LOC128526425 [Clarias gariepinus]|uniref:uncharacterized protein LOC128526425 n=1 Tax=Clarias gariepinus TaxID=13013 RepID=UPI00234C8ADC|nr:uncharacterized protein LOC128526425 [Clarias gariepinus]